MRRVMVEVPLDGGGPAWVRCHCFEDANPLVIMDTTTAEICLWPADRDDLSRGDVRLAREFARAATIYAAEVARRYQDQHRTGQQTLSRSGGEQ